ncbi:MAG: thiamine phosphate synthase [Candidatus Omnitrophota bacterium]|nr:thiamine phosphate synthase [Candidatus Omnitrophota bacterium]
MKQKKKLLKKSRLYVVIDKGVLRNRDLSNAVIKTRDTGAQIIQLRDKEQKKELILQNAYLLHKLLSKDNVIYIINDHLDIAKIVDSDGIHLGQNDIPIEIARRVLGKDKIIGISCHSLKQAQIAQKKGADYIGIGPIFPTPTKPENRKTINLKIIKILKKKIKIPFFVIGGINKNNIKLVTSRGVKRIAIASAILESKDISQATSYFSKILNSK